MKLVITMSRRFGTGASIIASELSERLGVPVYDKAYIEEKLNDHEYESEAEAIRKLAEKPCINVIPHANFTYMFVIKSRQKAFLCIVSQM